MGKHRKLPKNLDDKPIVSIVKDKDAKINRIESQNTMKDHGGKLWDSLFILIKDNDKQFIYDFCSRIPCKTCRDDFIIMLNRKDLDNKSREELIKILWECRGQIHDKYKKKSLQDYLIYLGLYK